MRRRLKIERLKRRMSQEAVASSLGITRVHYGKIERGAHLPRADVQARMVQLFGVGIEVLLDNNGENDGPIRGARIRGARNDA